MNESDEVPARGQLNSSGGDKSFEENKARRGDSAPASHWLFIK